MKRVSDDPVYIEWKRRHPRFPGVAECVDLLRRRNVRGSLVDIVCGELQNNASSHGAELLAAFESESDLRVRGILLGIIGEAKLSESLPILVENLRAADESLQVCAERGLRLLNTPESRKALWEAGKRRR